jgi:asparagine synthase (glutamine-hydrolysing)
MAGICATFGPNAFLLMQRICEELRHRGPDDEGHYSDQNIALGHRALKLGGAPLIHQPLANEDKTIWITFDGEIYNKDLIMQQLQKNHTLDTDSSAEVVVHSYEEKGPECLNQFNGMFAFCLWDLRKARLFCARDRFGMKPFYYFASDGTFLQASEIKALLPVIPAAIVPNETVVYDYLMNAHDDHTEETYFAGIKRLLPAHYLLIDETGVKLRKYWSPEVASKTKRLSKEDQSYASELRTLLRDSIRIRLPANLPIGTYLSGGIDSTSIAYLVSEILSVEVPKSGAVFGGFSGTN